MRIRTGITPGAWRDEGPTPATASFGANYASRPALPIGQMIPFAVGPAVVSEADRERASVRNQARREAYQAKARTRRAAIVKCAAEVRLGGGQCGRGRGHGGAHASTAALEKKALNRRAA